MKAEIIAIGSELLGPERLDTNSLYITECLNALGITVHVKTIVGDEAETLDQTIQAALGRSDIIIATGGLGPTEDDITREAFARALGRELVLNQAILDSLVQRFSKYAFKMPENNARQAMVLSGATALNNPKGTAPGIWAEERDRIIILLPGPPREMKSMLDHEVLPRLQARAGDRCLVRHILKVAGLTESMTDSLVAPVYTTYTNVATTILASPGQIELHLSAAGDTREQAETHMAPLEAQIAEILGPHLYSRQGESLEEVVAKALTAHHATLAAAESCTGGLLSERLTQRPGSSNYFHGGLICYSNESKVELCGVAESLLKEKGAVSAEVAEAMAQGVMRVYHTTIGLGITGVAGPSGGTTDKPVGLVFLALAHDEKISHKRYLFPGDREIIRFLASQGALDMIRREFLE
ncbi:MAG: competence/damage-inducible protein A [Acidobacteria bacterium]|nr:competence/damage-inducible protein A [Acidobacteriota bacterium]MBI3655962.1 competence/damage-inducible protein A [Acidobacteriota bacterium]